MTAEPTVPQVEINVTALKMRVGEIVFDLSQSEEWDLLENSWHPCWQVDCYPDLNNVIRPDLESAKQLALEVAPLIAERRAAAALETRLDGQLRKLAESKLEVDGDEPPF